MKAVNEMSDNFNEQEWFEDNCIIIKMGTNDVKMIGYTEFEEFLKHFDFKCNKIEHNILKQINTLELGIKEFEKTIKIHSNQSIILDINNSIEQLKSNIEMLNKILKSEN